MAAKSGMEGAGHRGAGRLVRVAGKLIALDEESARIVLAFQQEKRDRAARRPKRSLEEVVERRRAGGCSATTTLTAALPHLICS